MTNYIWRDSFDPRTYHIGSKQNERYFILVSLDKGYLQDLLELANDDWKQTAARIGEQPREVHLSLSLPLDMDYPVDEQP